MYILSQNTLKIGSGDLFVLVAKVGIYSDFQIAWTNLILSHYYIPRFNNSNGVICFAINVGKSLLTL